MTAKASYPDPFAGASGACPLFVSSTLGPCTEAADRARVDISEGMPGLPVRLALRIVDASCNPVANAKVKIWHTQVSGSYSGDTPAPQQCVFTAADAAKHCFRGVQTTDANGVVYFDSCFPGWYPGRCIHFHFTVSKGASSFTSQLGFDDTLAADIFATHVDYKDRGQPDTSNTEDGIAVGQGLAAFTMTTARMSDGAMLASKQVAVNFS
jgi:protocatechuate 3,4-dioxygenase beta subunit